MTDIYARTTDKIDVAYVAHLARLHLSEDEKQRIQRQLGQVVEYVDQLKALDVDNVEPMAHAVPMQNVFRKDEMRPGLDHEAAMRNAPRERNGQFSVPSIIE